MLSVLYHSLCATCNKHYGGNQCGGLAGMSKMETALGSFNARNAA